MLYRPLDGDHLLLPHLRLFKKNTKRGQELVSLPYFLHDFGREFFSCYILLTDQISLFGCLYFVRY